MNKKSYVFFLSFLTLFFLNCTDSKKEKEIAQIPMNVKLVRFDSLFFNTPEQNYEKLKADFPYFFPASTPDSIWKNKQKEPLQRELYGEVVKQFGNFSQEKKEIKNLFQHIKYNYPAFIPPKIITVTSDVDYAYRVIYTDSLLIIGLDNYLGETHRFYQSFPAYTRFELQKKFLLVDVALHISEKMLPAERYQNFLEVMIGQGKKIFLASEFLPKTSEDMLLKYPQKKYQWALENESEIWRYFIENELLYSTDPKMLQRFIQPAPFSKFYLEHDQESPGGIGQFIGLKIVQAYVKKYPEKAHKLGEIPNEIIFKKANYKPNKTSF